MLSQKNPDDKIIVDLDLKELDLTSAECKATYKEIKNYVQSNHNLKVSSLYIAQVKEKFGIKERDNYNISQKTNAKVPICPQKKEAAIKEALKHFKMI